MGVIPRFHRSTAPTFNSRSNRWSRNRAGPLWATGDVANWGCCREMPRLPAPSPPPRAIRASRGSAKSAIAQPPMAASDSLGRLEFSSLMVGFAVNEKYPAEILDPRIPGSPLAPTIWGLPPAQSRGRRIRGGGRKDPDAHGAMVDGNGRLSLKQDATCMYAGRI
jgi:hypothetical protein